MQKHDDYQNRQHDQTGGADEQQKKEQPVSRHQTPAGSSAIARKQVVIHAVRFPYHVEDVSDDGDGPDQRVDTNICHHPHDRDPRQPALPCGNDNQEGQQSGDDVAQPRHESHNGIKAEADPGAGNVEDVVQNSGEVVELLVGESSRGRPSRRREDFGLYAWHIASCPMVIVILLRCRKR